MNLKEENEKLRELLRRVYNYVPIPDQIRIDSALSQQDGNEVASPAQDEREAFEHWHAAQEAGLAPEGVRAIHLGKEVYWQGWQARATLPAQKVNNVETPEQQPVAWQHKKPTVNDSGEIVGYSAWTNGKGLDWWPHRPLYAAPHKGK